MQRTGILVVDKPGGFTSFDVVAKLRGVLGQKKIGHGGTLDPLATGVLPLFLGGATRAVDLLPNSQKRYTATVRFGQRTDSGDVTGEVLEQSDALPAAEQLEIAARAFVGVTKQTPPMYSAVKVNGKRLYELARKGQTVERRAREITVSSIELLDYRAGQKIAMFDIECSKGTYIRTLAEDIAARCGALASIAALRRTASAGFTLEYSHTIEQIERAAKNGGLDEMILSAELPFWGYAAVQLDLAAANRYRNGAPVYRIGAPPGIVRVLGPAGFLGLGKVDAEATLTTYRQFV